MNYFISIRNPFISRWILNGDNNSSKDFVSWLMNLLTTRLSFLFFSFSLFLVWISVLSDDRLLKDFNANPPSPTSKVSRRKFTVVFCRTLIWGTDKLDRPYTSWNCLQLTRLVPTLAQPSRLVPTLTQPSRLVSTLHQPWRLVLPITGLIFQPSGLVQG